MLKKILFKLSRSFVKLLLPCFSSLFIRLKINKRIANYLNDKSSDLFQIIEDREGYDLMPEQECKPNNKYLPPRHNRTKFSETSLKPIINSFYQKTD